MTEQAAFSDLVHEAFIQPLRSVLIVDDQYPTWEEILNAKIEGVNQDSDLEKRSSEKAWISQPGESLGVIKSLRKNKPGLVIDLHDPHSSSGDAAEELADHLHQSDLLILDYNLEGQDSGLGGSKAREVLQHILSSNHFNLVLVHTDDSDLDHVMSECLVSLMSRLTVQFDEKTQAGLKKLDVKLDDLEQEDKFDRDRLSAFVDLSTYLQVRQSGCDLAEVLREFMRQEGILAKLSAWGSEIGLEGGNLKYFFYWALREFEQPRSEEFQGGTAGELKWKFDGQCRWLRTSKGFVTFVKKGPENLINELQKALENWKPTPSRLLSAKYRHELSSIGVAAEDASLANALVHAQFYDGICSKRNNSSQMQTKLKEYVSRQSEAVSFLIEDDVVLFGEKIVKADAPPENNFAAHYGVDLTEESVSKNAVNSYNSYVSTLPEKLGDDQLDSGHIFELNNDWWICATPACDLQPGQTTISFGGGSSALRPFTAVKLVKIDVSDLDNNHINSGSCCFIQDRKSDGVVCLSLRTADDERKPATQKVTWRTFVAKDQGKITDGVCDIINLKLSEAEIKLYDEQIHIRAKLRYEYALNYIQRVGVSVSRIGLGYAPYST